MKSEKFQYVTNDASGKDDINDMNEGFDSEESDIIVKAPSELSDEDPMYDTWFSSSTDLTYQGGLLNSSATTYSNNVVENCTFNYELGGVLTETIEVKTDPDGVNQTRKTDLTYDSQGLLVAITETVELGE